MTFQVAVMIRSDTAELYRMPSGAHTPPIIVRLCANSNLSLERYAVGYTHGQ